MKLSFTATTTFATIHSISPIYTTLTRPIFRTGSSSLLTYSLKISTRQTKRSFRTQPNSWIHCKRAKMEHIKNKKSELIISKCSTYKVCLYLHSYYRAARDYDKYAERNQELLKKAEKGHWSTREHATLVSSKIFRMNQERLTSCAFHIDQTASRKEYMDLCSEEYKKSVVTILLRGKLISF